MIAIQPRKTILKLEYIEIYRFDSGVELVTPDIEEEVAENDNLPPWKR